jgi:hypothetical protein
MSNATLIAHVDCHYRTRDQLQAILTPEATRTWKPVPHYELVTRLIESIQAKGVQVLREQYCAGGPNDCKLYGTLDLAIPDLTTTDYGMAIGLRTANNRCSAVHLIAAASVFVCDNRAFSGSGGSVVLKKRHVGGLDIDGILPPAIDLYLDKAGVWRQDIDRMQDYSLTDGRAKELIYDAFVGGEGRAVMPVRMLDDVHHLYFADDEQRAKHPQRSLWGLNNAFTQAVKGLQPMPQEQAGIEIGRYFARVLNVRNESFVAVNGVAFDGAAEAFAELN